VRALERGRPCSRERLAGLLWWATGATVAWTVPCVFRVRFAECLCFVFFAGFKQDSPGFLGDPRGCPRHKDLIVRFCWEKMREDIAGYVARCDTCQRVKAEHQRPVGLLQPLEISTWNWDNINMDIIVGLPRTQKGNTPFG
jgi:hypothetical protein